MTLSKYGIPADLVVRGLTLPLDYFYRGKIELKESYSDADIRKDLNIKGILKKLQQLHYDSNIIIESEDDYDSNKKVEQETCTHCTKSEEELNVAAEVIDEQLEELIDEISSYHTSRMSISSDSLLDPAKSTSPKRSVTSVTDIKSLLIQTCNSIISSHAIGHNLSLKFSDLDDGPLGKGSNATLHNPHGQSGKKTKLLHDTSNMAIHHKYQDRLTSKSKLQNNMMQATNNIIKFIDEKKKVYSRR